MTLHLDDLREAIQTELDASAFAVFRGRPDASETIPSLFWDTDSEPDFRAFLHVAKQAGARIVILSHRQFQEEELDDALAELEDSGLPRNERRNVESGLRGLRKHAGRTCTLELSFSHDGRLYVFRLAAEWYEEFVALTDFLDLALPSEDEDDEAGPPLSGYFSKN